MRRVYTTESVALAWHVRNVLEQHDIDAVVKNERLYSVAGEVPITECMPEVWVKPLDFRRAEQIIRSIETATEPAGPDWTCENCKEPNAANFDLCWNCQHASPPDTNITDT